MFLFVYANVMYVYIRVGGQKNYHGAPTFTATLSMVPSLSLGDVALATESFIVDGSGTVLLTDVFWSATTPCSLNVSLDDPQGLCTFEIVQGSQVLDPADAGLYLDVTCSSVSTTYDVVPMNVTMELCDGLAVRICIDTHIFIICSCV